MKKLLITILAMVSFANISYAAGKHSTGITIYENVYVGGHVLTPGEYTAKWVDGSNEMSITGNHANFSVPVTVTPGAAGPLALSISPDGDKRVLRGLQVQSTSITIVDSKNVGTNSAQ